MEIGVKFILEEGAIRPHRCYSGDAGYDLCAMDYYMVDCGSVTLIRTGVSLDIESGYYAEVRGRSSAGTRGLIVLSGTIDNGYKGEIKIQVVALDGMVQIYKGDRLAQLIFKPLITVRGEDTLYPRDRKRKDNGFGSTGG